MRAGLVISTALHAALLGYGLLALSAPPPLQVADVEAFPVDIVPVAEVSRVQQGDRKAPAAEKSAPKPTPRPDPVPQARNVGNNTVDNDSAPTPQAKPREVKTAAAPKPTPEPTPKPAPQPPERTASTAEPKPAPATEQTVKERPKQEVAPDPVKQAAVAENPDAAPVKLPTTAPAPQARPQPPQAQTAKAPERKIAEKPAEKPAQQPKADTPDDTLDEVAALLSKEAPSGGGARRSTETAALGGRRTTEGVKLSQSEEDALRQQLSGCWSIPAGAADSGGLRATVRFSLNRDGRLDGRPTVQNPSGNQQFDESAVRAVQKCDQVGLLVPKGKYEVWAEVLVNFDPREMF